MSTYSMIPNRFGFPEHTSHTISDFLLNSLEFSMACGVWLQFFTLSNPQQLERVMSKPPSASSNASSMGRRGTTEAVRVYKHRDTLESDVLRLHPIFINERQLLNKAAKIHGPEPQDCFYDVIARGRGYNDHKQASVTLHQ